MKPFVKECLCWFGTGFVLGAVAAPLFLAALMAYYGWGPAALSIYSGSPFAVIISNPKVEILGTDVPVTMPTMFILVALLGGLAGGVVALTVGCLLRLAYGRTLKS